MQVAFGAYVGGPGKTVFALLGAIVFSGYIVFDTENLISRLGLSCASHYLCLCLCKLFYSFLSYIIHCTSLTRLSETVNIL